jgi:hypothetical protein
MNTMNEQQFNNMLLAASIWMWLNDQSLAVQTWKN